MIFFSLLFLCGKNPRNVNSFIEKPEFINAGIKAVAPGRQETFILFFMQCLTNKKPGSDIIGVPASVIKAILLHFFKKSIMLNIIFCSLYILYDNILFFILKKFNNFLEFKIFSAKIKSTSFRIRIALKVISSKLPIGVGTIYNMINYYYETKFHLYNEFYFSKWIFFVVSKEKKFIKELNLIFCNDKYLININKKYLNKNYYTDVITFDNSEDKNIDGDIFISIKRIKYNSLNFKKSFYDELKRIIIHAVLHLLGYKDKKETEKYIMSKKEEIYLFFLKKKYVC